MLLQRLSQVASVEIPVFKAILSAPCEAVILVQSLAACKLGRMYLSVSPSATYLALPTWPRLGPLLAAKVQVLHLSGWGPTLLKLRDVHHGKSSWIGKRFDSICWL